MSGLIDLPGGFQVAPILQWESARPYTAGYGGTFDVLGVGSGRGTSHVILTSANPGDLFATTKPPFADPVTGTINTRLIRDCLRAGQCFIAPFSNLRGQPFFQLDTRISKNFRIRERATLTTFLQIFDLTNRANFGNNFSNNVRSGASAFGKPVGYITPNGVTVPHSLSAELGVKFVF
jgi:hypothetical protein